MGNHSLAGDRYRHGLKICAKRLRKPGQFIKSAGVHDVDDSTPYAFYEFKHSLYRQAVYRKLSDVSRSRLHRNMGERLSALYNANRRELALELACISRKVAITTVPFITCCSPRRMRPEGLLTGTPSKYCSTPEAYAPSSMQIRVSSARY